MQDKYLLFAEIIHVKEVIINKSKIYIYLYCYAGYTTISHAKLQLLFDDCAIMNVFCDVERFTITNYKKKQENALKMMLQPTSGRRGFDYVKESTDDKSQ